MIARHWRGGKRTWIGLDIGQAAVRAVQLERCGDAFTVIGAAVELPRGTTGQTAGSTNESPQPFRGGAVPGHPPLAAPEPGADSARQPALPARIRECIGEGLFRGRLVQSGVNTPAVAYYPLELPGDVIQGADNDLRPAVRAEVERLTNLPLSEMEVRYWRLPASRGPSPNVLAASAARSDVARLLDACDEAGLDCLSIDAAAAALARFGGLLSHWPADRVWGVLDLGHRHAVVVLCVDQTPVLIRRIGSSGEVWTRLIAESLQVSEQAAEVQKRQHGISSSARGLRAGGGTAPASEIGAILFAILRHELRDIAAEVKRSYDYVLSCYPNRNAGGLILVGGGAVMKNLGPYLRGALGIDVRTASDFLECADCRLRHASGKQRRLESFATAIGLAVGADSANGANGC